MARESPAQKAARLNRIVKAWEALDPNRTFFGFTLAKYKALIQPGLDACAELDELKGRTRHALQRRNAEFRKALQVSKNIVSGVLGDPNHGEDGALYAAMGYIPRHARRKPRRRKKPKSSVTNSRSARRVKA